MVKKNITLKFRRQREGKTDYRKRLSLLKSGATRVIIRRYANSVIVQLSNYDEIGDKTQIYVRSVELKKFGWNASTGNIPAAYLTGFLAGKKAIAKKIDAGIVDLGLQKSSKESRIYAAVKGLIDAGVKINCDEKVLPSEERIKGLHISNYAKVLKKNKTQGQENVFSKYTKEKVDVEKIEDLVELTKKKINDLK
jgi:large subunit ribosomal protein L18